MNSFITLLKEKVLVSLTAVFTAILTALNVLGTNIIKPICTDESLIAKIGFVEFMSKSQKVCEIPDLDTEFVPQGLCYCEAMGKILICGYMEDGSASRIYIMNCDSGKKEKYINLLNKDGSDYTGHCGGVASYMDNVWVVSGNYARRFSAAALKEESNDGGVKLIDMFNSGTRASYINFSNGILWVGEYHKDGNNYVTEDSHHLTAPDGKGMCAWTCGYKLDKTNPQGFTYNGTSKKVVVPDYVLETESMCQGFAQLPDGRFVTSISGSILNSKLNIYNNVIDRENDATVDFDGVNVPMWYLDSGAKADSLTAIPRSEGLDFAQGKLLVVFESGSKKLVATQIVHTESVWAVEL